MKLAIITAFPPSKVTLNEYGYHLVKNFATNNEVTEIVLLTDADVPTNSIDIDQSSCKLTIRKCWEFNSYTNVFDIMKVINETQPDSILFNLQFMKFGDKKVPAALGLIAPLLCKLKKIPTIVLLHNILEQVDLESAGFTSNILLNKAYNFIGSMLTRVLLKADLVAVTMEKYITILKEKYNANNVVLIPHGTFELASEFVQKPIAKEPMQIMTFGKFGTYKKVEPMIDAVIRVRTKLGIPLEVVVAGTDNPNVPGYLEGVKLKYKDIPNIRFTGYVEEEDVPKIFNDAAMVVFPYTSTTGSSGVLHQAGSYAKAVIMPDLGDLALLVKDEGYLGEFFEPEDVQSLANAIEKLVIDEAYRNEMGLTNYKAAHAFPMNKITDMYIEHFKQISILNSDLQYI